MGLTGLDSKRYRAILRAKHQAIKSLKAGFGPNEIEEPLISGRVIDDSGEIVVRHLVHPYRKDFSNDDAERIISDYRSGKSTIYIAEQFGCSKNTINKLLRQHDVNVTSTKAQAKLDTAVIIAMYEERHTIEEIAEYFSVSSNTINRCLRSSGVKIRSRWDYAGK